QRLALGEDPPHVGHRLRRADPGAHPVVALAPHALPGLAGRSLQPDRVAGLEQALESGQFGNEAAARRNHDLRVRAQQTLDRAPLVAPVGGLAEEVEYLADAHPRGALDFAAELHEAPAEPFRKRRAKRALAGAAQSD